MTNKIADLEAALAAATSARQKVDALNALAWELRDADTVRGVQLAETAHALAQAEQYQSGIAASLVARAQFIFSDYLLALSQGSQALAIFEELGDLIGQGRALLTMCWAYWSLDDFVAAVEAGLRARNLAQEGGDRTLEADVLNNLGLVYKRSGNYELGYTVYAEALALYRDLGNRLSESKVLTNFALAYAAQGQYDNALAYARECFQMKIDNPAINGYTFLALGQAYAGKQAFDEAISNLRRALQIAREQALDQLSLAAMYSLGQIHMERQESGRALAQFQQALALAEKIKSLLYVFQCHQALSQVYESQENLPLALTHYKAFHAAKETVFSDKNTSRLQILEIHHQTEIARREAEIYQLRNVELEQEIAERRHLEAQLQQQATTDVLTGLSNRRHFMELASYEWKRACRAASPLSLALIDIDNFKQINDTYGHAGGDRALIAFTKFFQERIREIDLLARFGGDEFVMLFPGTKDEMARKALDRVRQGLVAQPVHLDGKRVALTISAGVSSMNGECDSLDVLLGRADKALYQAKEAGRNRIVIG